MENLSWRLLFMHNVLVDDNKSAKNFKKLSKNASEKLDKDKNRNIEELQAPKFKRTESTDVMLKKANERTRRLSNPSSNQPNNQSDTHKFDNNFDLKNFLYDDSSSDPFDLDLENIPGFENFLTKPQLYNDQSILKSNYMKSSPPPATPSLLSNSNQRPSCSNCGAISTPLWRRSAADELLCNACGLYLKLHKSHRPKSLKSSRSAQHANPPGEWTSIKPDPDQEIVPSGPLITCANCDTSTTPLWRKSDDGNTLCNACGLYLKLHKSQRPLSMKTDIIKKRTRYDPIDKNGRFSSFDNSPTDSPITSRMSSPVRELTQSALAGIGLPIPGIPNYQQLRNQFYDNVETSHAHNIAVFDGMELSSVDNERSTREGSLASSDDYIQPNQSISNNNSDNDTSNSYNSSNNCNRKDGNEVPKRRRLTNDSALSALKPMTPVNTPGTQTNQPNSTLSFQQAVNQVNFTPNNTPPFPTPASLNNYADQSTSINSSPYSFNQTLFGAGTSVNGEDMSRVNSMDQQQQQQQHYSQTNINVQPQNQLNQQHYNQQHYNQQPFLQHQHQSQPQQREQHQHEAQQHQQQHQQFNPQPPSIFDNQPMTDAYDFALFGGDLPNNILNEPKGLGIDIDGSGFK